MSAWRKPGYSAPPDLPNGDDGVVGEARLMAAAEKVARPRSARVATTGDSKMRIGVRLERMPSLTPLHDEVLARTHSVTRDELTSNSPEQALRVGRLSWPESVEGVSFSSPAAPVPWSPTHGAQAAASGFAGWPIPLRSNSWDSIISLSDTPDSGGRADQVAPPTLHRRHNSSALNLEALQPASAPNARPLSLSQRRGLAIRRLVIPISNRSTLMPGDGRQKPAKPQPTDGAFAVHRPASEWRLQRRAAGRAPEDAAGTMGEYRRAMELKRRQPMGAGAPEVQVQPWTRVQTHTPSPRHSRQLQLKILRSPSQEGQPAHAALPVRILVALLLFCKALLLLPITIVQALLSPKPPWCPRTPSSGEANRKWPIRRCTSLSPMGPPAFEALMEPYTP